MIVPRHAEFQCGKRVWWKSFEANHDEKMEFGEIVPVLDEKDSMIEITMFFFGWIPYDTCSPQL